ncbi:MFS transporter [Georgenia daeguensis]|uniref:MFS transporter n=1 Tax=Georgenia daeguensis TaxID=908355 RepID=A0ABP8ENS3_9MICO
MPLYPLYALLFADAGLSGAEISALFAIWSAVAVVAEVPTGLLADRFSRRGAVVASSLLQAAAFALWVLEPTFTAFAAGFALWAIGGACASGAFEALLFDGLDAAGARKLYPKVLGRVEAAALVAQAPAALAATGLFAVGGFGLVGAVSVAMCLIAAVLATRLPATRHGPAPGDETRTALRDVVKDVRATVARRGVRGAVVLVALLLAVDGLEEYFPLLAAEQGVPTVWVPLVVLVIPLAGALGAWLGGRARHVPVTRLALVLAVGAALLAVVGQIAHPAGVAVVAVFYGIYQAVRVISEARLQELIPSPHRASITSVAGVGSEVATLGVYGAWAFGGTSAVAAGVMLLAVALPHLLGGRAARRAPASQPDGSPASRADQ